MPQVGVSKFRIDLGIVHPDGPGDYLLGIECDGASYHSAATARDRDKVRAAILESLGWTLLRIWSTDWWIDRERAADRLHGQIEEKLAANRAATAACGTQRAPVADIQIAEPNRPEATITASPVAALQTPKPPAEPVSPVPDDGLYRLTDFTPLAATIDPAVFYDPLYDASLTTLVGHVLNAEAPIAENLLVQRIARAHGFQRAGRIIRDRIMALVERLHYVEAEAGGRRFVWIDATTRASWNRARFPAGEADIRQIEDISIAELRAARAGRDNLDVARSFGIRRLSTSARARVDAA